MSQESLRVPGYSAARLRDGCVLATIAHALWIADDETMAALHDWQDSSYIVQDLEGSTGVLTFFAGGVLGVCCNIKCSDYQAAAHTDPMTLLFLAPPTIADIARSTSLRFLTHRVGSVARPVATGAFWCEGEESWSPLDRATLENNGWHMIRTQDKPWRQGLNDWIADFALDESRARLVTKIADRRLTSADHSIVLTGEERAGIVANGADGLGECRRLLAAVGVNWGDQSPKACSGDTEHGR